MKCTRYLDYSTPQNYNLDGGKGVYAHKSDIVIQKIII